MFSRRPALAMLVMMLLLPLTFSGAAAAEGSTESVSNFPPQPDGEWYILDAADVISNETEDEWEASLRATHEETGRLVRIVTISRMCDFDERLHRGEQDFRMCEIDWTFDECYECGTMEPEYGTDDSYAGRMFRAYGMGGTDEPSMLIGVSTEDRRFRYVMPDHTTSEQVFSGQQFETHSWRLSDAADGYGSWEDALEPHVGFGLLVSEGKTEPYSAVVQTALIGGLVVAVLGMILVIGGNTKAQISSEPAKNRLALGAYREMAVLIHARMTLDGNFGSMERYREHIEAIEKQMAMYRDVVTGVRKRGEPLIEHNEPIEEYEEEELRKVLAEIEACFEEMDLHTSQGRQEVEASVAFTPLEYGQDVERIHVERDAFRSRWKAFRAPAWAGFALAGVFVAASFVEQGPAFGSVSPYHFALHTGNVWPLFGGLIPLFIGLVTEGLAAGSTMVEGLPERGTTAVDYASLGWPMFGASVAYGYGAELVGHDEHGSPIFETHRVHSDSGSDGGGGGGCGGGGCGGGGCGGGGGF
ncbi:MAG TPA: hypothetical protein HA286_03445 [Candidatus Poseidoniaceae archaeon]|nr:hypothetical protein [Candidatus Poseidoniaceae archaeon]